MRGEGFGWFVVVAVAALGCWVFLFALSVGELAEKTGRLCEVACEGRPPVTFGDECYCADVVGGFGPPSGRCGGGR